jgi:radical SAM protein with 4Fe4S-binding SPASM domain
MLINSFTFYFKPTNRCNLCCEHCYVPEDKRMESTDFMSTDQAITILKKIEDYFKDKCPKVRILFHGGEPMLAGVDFYRKIYEHFKNSSVFDFGFQTNLTLYNSEWDDVITNMFNSYVGTSFDLTRKTKGGFEDFQRIWEEKYFLFKEKFKVSIEFTVTKVFLSKPIDFWIDFIERHNPDIFSFGWYTDVHSKSELFVCYNDYLKFIIDFTKHWLNRGHFLNFKPVRGIFGITYNPILNKHQFSYDGACMFNTFCSDNHLVINPNGEVGICPALSANDFNFGNIFKQEIDEILNSKERLQFIAFQKTPPIECLSCNYFVICNTGCPFLRKLGLLQKDKCVDFFKFFEELSLKILKKEIKGAEIENEKLTVKYSVY